VDTGFHESIQSRKSPVPSITNMHNLYDRSCNSQSHVMNSAVIVDAVRTPFGKRAACSGHASTGSCRRAARGVLRRATASSRRDDRDVIYGCVTPVDEQRHEYPGDLRRWSPAGAISCREYSSTECAVRASRRPTSPRRTSWLAARRAHRGRAEHMTPRPDGPDGDSLTDTYFRALLTSWTTQGRGAERIAEE